MPPGVSHPLWLLHSSSSSLNPSVRPDPQSRDAINPTLMMSWWATMFSFAIIITRFVGRYLRVERFFPEDKIAMASSIPLLIRMAFLHVVLIWGTNNVKTEGMSPLEIQHREIGGRLVLVTRIFYAIFIWTTKLTVCEFLKRLSGMVWKRSMGVFLKFIYVFLASTLVAVVIATLAECQPFNHYWQVIPDPGAKCRAGYANLIAMGTCDVITDLLLVAFPIPIILTASMPWKQKIALSLLLALSLVMVAITLFRVPSVIDRGGSQGYRSLIASMEILAATATSNAVVIGSFIRDRGLKKPKYRRDVGTASVSESLDHTSFTRANLAYHQWGSDSDLAAGLGIRLPQELQPAEQVEPRPAPVAPTAAQTEHPLWYYGQQPSLIDDNTQASLISEPNVDPHEYPHDKTNLDSHDWAVSSSRPRGDTLVQTLPTPSSSGPSNVSSDSTNVEKTASRS